MQVYWLIQPCRFVLYWPHINGSLYYWNIDISLGRLRQTKYKICLRVFARDVHSSLLAPFISEERKKVDIFTSLRVSCSEVGSEQESGSEFGSGWESGSEFGSGWKSGSEFGSGWESGSEFGSGWESGSEFGSGWESGSELGSTLECGPAGGSLSQTSVEEGFLGFRPLGGFGGSGDKNSRLPDSDEVLLSML